jgi:RNA polymerase sigma-70 factor, ECF subfamily
MAYPVEDELEATVREHAHLVFRIGYSVLRNAADAEDAAQETFLRMLKHRHKIAELADRKAWVARIAWRVAVDRKRAQSPVSADLETVAAEVNAAMAGSQPNVEQVAAGRQMQSLLEQLIASLPRDLRDVVLLATVEELNTRELAAALGVNEGTARTRLHRGRQMLREKLAAVLGGNHAG